MTVIHADINSFYASAEQLFRPDLKGKPVMVLSNNDGCVALIEVPFAEPKRLPMLA